MPVKNKRVYITFIIFLVLLISYLHYREVPGLGALRGIYRDLYYVPILMGALIFGLRGAIMTFLFVAALYSPFIFLTSSGSILPLLDRLLYVSMLAIVALISGLLVDRQRKVRSQAEKTKYLASLGEAASAIVHELKNPLITIEGFARRLREKKIDPGEAADIIAHSAGKMQMTVREVLDFAKPLTLSLRNSDTKKVIGAAVDSCRIKAEKAGVAISLMLPQQPLFLYVDGHRLERALVDFIDNAIDASKEGQTVTVGAATKGGTLSIWITDKGCGMDKETLDKVFTPFYTKKKAGTGLGMAIAKKIIEEHGGRITIKSKPEHGTEVMIEMKLKRVESASGPS